MRLRGDHRKRRQLGQRQGEAIDGIDIKGVIQDLRSTLVTVAGKNAPGVPADGDLRTSVVEVAIGSSKSLAGNIYPPAADSSVFHQESGGGSGVDRNGVARSSNSTGMQLNGAIAGIRPKDEALNAVGGRHLGEHDPYRIQCIEINSRLAILKIHRVVGPIRNRPGAGLGNSCTEAYVVSLDIDESGVGPFVPSHHNAGAVLVYPGGVSASCCRRIGKSGTGPVGGREIDLFEPADVRDIVDFDTLIQRRTIDIKNYGATAAVDGRELHPVIGIDESDVPGIIEIVAEIVRLTEDDGGRIRNDIIR